MTGEQRCVVGLAGLELPHPMIDLGRGIILRRTYAHVMAPYVAAFIPAEENRPHPAPWKTVGGGSAFDIYTELLVPRDASLRENFGPLDIAWWIVHLCRMRISPGISVPVFASHPFATIPDLEEEPEFWPMEMAPRRLNPKPEQSGQATDQDVAWLKRHWEGSATKLSGSEDFRSAVEAASYCIWHVTPALALVTLWGAIERLLLSSPSELTFRVSLILATLLEPPGAPRKRLYKKARKLYGSRSRVAHGSSAEAADAFSETYNLLVRLLTKWIEEEEVPTKATIEDVNGG